MDETIWRGLRMSTSPLARIAQREPAERGSREENQWFNCDVIYKTRPTKIQRKTAALWKSQSSKRSQLAGLFSPQFAQIHCLTSAWGRRTVTFMNGLKDRLSPAPWSLNKENSFLSIVRQAQRGKMRKQFRAAMLASIILSAGCATPNYIYRAIHASYDKNYEHAVIKKK